MMTATPIVTTNEDVFRIAVNGARLRIICIATSYRQIMKLRRTQGLTPPAGGYM